MKSAVELPRKYPRKFVWFMECDVCRETRSNPAWTQDALPLERFESEGWRCRYSEDPLDTCPACLAKGVTS